MAKKKKYLPEFSLTLEDVPADVGVFLTKKGLRGWLRERGIEEHFLDRKARAYAGYYEYDGLDWFCIYVDPKAKVSVIAHECLHVTHYIMDSHGIPITYENTEIQALILKRLIQLFYIAFAEYSDKTGE